MKHLTIPAEVFLEFKKLEQKLEIALKFINSQAEYECYMMCGCQQDAKETLEKIETLTK